MEATIVYWGDIGIMENQMEASIMGYIGFRVWASNASVANLKPCWTFPARFHVQAAPERNSLLTLKLCLENLFLR